MADRQRPGNGTGTSTATARRRLRREVPGTLGLLADAADFAAMRRYRSFVFDDHAAYLHQVEDLLRTGRTEGLHTSVALFDPEEYALYCADTGLEPDAATSRAVFTASLASTGATLAYEGQPLAELLPELVDEAVRQATWEVASGLLAEIGACADCGQDIGRALLDRATRLLVRLLDAAGPGHHHLVCSAPVEDSHLLAALTVDRASHGDPRGWEEGDRIPDEDEALEFAAVLAVALASRGTGAVVLRTRRPGHPDRIHGWTARAARLQPLTAAEVFNAYCHDLETGDLIGPESGVEYCAGTDLPDAPDDHRHRRHD
ncbi:hypothetical protein [Streptomyces sp. NPDC060194]|uniref:hypothetical protein n=1 Tax=Streptomyces sp. NPDC060194 TaxID=3347069 RepID=UPI003659CA27